MALDTTATPAIGYNQFERVYVKTDSPVAVESPDYVQPRGTLQDNSRYPRFNTKVYALFENLRRPLAVLDLGCSGGGFVKSCIDDGCIAVGIEGSDYSMRMGRAEWADLGGRYLFTADITRPFEVRAVYAGTEAPLSCDLITAWEVLEHIAEPDIDGVCRNIAEHLAPSGIVTMSISIVEQEHNGVKLHQTVKPKSWWLAKFAEHGLDHQPQLEAYFSGQFVRGWGPEAGESIHLVLAGRTGQAPVAPARSWKTRLADTWFGSRPYWYVRRGLGIE